MIDVSGSMGDAMSDVKATLVALLNSLAPQDRVSLITFSEKISVQFPLRQIDEANAKATALRLVQQLAAGGSTNISGAMDSALQVISSAPKTTQSTPRLSIVLLLSDGQPNAGICGAPRLSAHLQAAVAKLMSAPQAPLFVVHTLGFTTGHDSNVLRAIAQVGSAGVGLYYFLRTVADIPAAVGDALGSTASVLFHNVRIEAQVIDASQAPALGFSCVVYSGAQLDAIVPTGPTHVGFMASSDHKNVVLICLPTLLTAEAPAAVAVTISYSNSRSGQEMVVKKLVPIPELALIPADVAAHPANDDDDGSEEEIALDRVRFESIVWDAQSLHTIVHVIRTRASGTTLSVLYLVRAN